MSVKGRAVTFTDLFRVLKGSFHENGGSTNISFPAVFGQCVY